MAVLYYGRGNCSVEGNVSSLSINYTGNIIIDSKLPDGYVVIIEKRILNINPFLKPQNLNELFAYIGELRINSVRANDSEGERVPTTATRVMDYAELLSTKSEDLTVKSEDLSATHVHGRTFTKTRLLPKVIENLQTSIIDKTLFLNNEEYIGSFHLHNDGTIMSGLKHTKDSQVLKESII